jgi:hypothetical protein
MLCCDCDRQRPEARGPAPIGVLPHLVGMRGGGDYCDGSCKGHAVPAACRLQVDSICTQLFVVTQTTQGKPGQ